MENKESKLLSEVQTYYQVGPNFARAYLEHWQRGFDRPCSSLAEIHRLPPPQSIWFKFAMMSNLRGQQIAQQVSPYIPPAAHRYLDIGCGLGGSLVAFSKLGLEVTGIDINDQLIHLTKANCSDHQLPECTLKGDILDEIFAASLGTFDVITALAVIEHVADVKIMLQNATRLLNPGGMLVLDIPNKDSLSFVARDPHYSLFGLTLLERPQAIQYYEKFYAEEYDVGEFYPLSFYIDYLKGLGCSSKVIDTPETSPRFARDLAMPFWLFYRYLIYRWKINKQISTSTQTQISTNFSKYVNGLRKDISDAFSNWSKDQSFRVKYLTNVWTVVAHKHQ